MKLKTLLLAGLVAITIVSATACAMTPATGGSSSGRNRVSGDELAATNSPMVYEALSLLRPQWMTSRGAVSMDEPDFAVANIYQNGTRIGDIEYLKQVYVLDVDYLQFWPPGEAGARFGMGNPRGVIEIFLK